MALFGVLFKLIGEAGLTILVVEQQMVREGPAEELKRNSHMREVYLGR